MDAGDLPAEAGSKVVNSQAPAASPFSAIAQRHWRTLALTTLVLGTALGGFWYVQSQRDVARELVSLQSARLEAMEDSLKALRVDQRANARTLQDAGASNRLLRDEVLGLSQRNALLEQSVEQLSADSRQGLQLLRQEEAEVLLTSALHRMEYAHDLESARRLYTLADGLLARLDGADQLNLRQALLQERRVLDAMGEDPRKAHAKALEQITKGLMALELQPPADTVPLTWWQQLLAPLVDIHPSSGDTPIAANQRQQAIDSLQLEISLARAALERSDAEAWQQALRRIDDWTIRLWPAGPARQRQRQALEKLQLAPLGLTAPELGSTLRQMRHLREGNTSP